MTDPNRIPLELTRQQVEMVQTWAVRNIRAINGQGGVLNAYEREKLTEYREIDAAVNSAIAAQLRAHTGEGE